MAKAKAQIVSITGETVEIRKKGNSAVKPKVRSVSATRKRNRQKTMAIVIASVAFIGTVLSLDHLAHGVGIITGNLSWREWSMAILIDCLFLSLEGAEIFAMSDYVRKQVKKYTHKTIIALILGSAMFNATAFIHPVLGNWILMVPAALLGISIPVLIYYAMRASATLWLEASKNH